MRFETFAPLTGFPNAFTLRDPGTDTRSENFPAQIAATLCYSNYAMAEQPHGHGIAIVEQPGFYAGVDALITQHPGLPLLVRCADCAPIFLINRRVPAVALIHSGKQGTLANIAGQTVRALPGIPQDWLAYIGPCIGPCHYEMDLWTGIETQLRAAGLTEIHNPRVCTACHLDRYYSYRAERGQTGRMFGLLVLPGE